MKAQKNKTKFSCITRITLILTVFFLFSCEHFLQVDLPTTLISQDQVFKDDITATSAVKGIYADLIQINSFASGSNVCAATLTGLSGDELRTYLYNSDYASLEKNLLSADNQSVLNLWTTAYKTIYDCNSAIEGLTNSAALTSTVKDQLTGEALFIRAYCHFYLVNLFGATPLVTSANYETNAAISRSAPDEVYRQITDDLTQARTLLSETYQGTGGRIRVNKSAATALLARVSLYSKDWASAESMAGVVLDNATTYKLAALPKDVFLATSPEAIWQLKLAATQLKTYTTFEGYFFRIQSSADLYYSILSKHLLNAFESNDLRKDSWIGRYISGADTLYYANKYKEKYQSDPPKECSMMLRLAEQYLIRAEARAMQDKLGSAIDDLNAIRGRAGLLLIQKTNPAITKDSLLLAIEQERRVELFTEGAHRWFDLKRRDRASKVLGTEKSSWSSHYELYPIPQAELAKNSRLGDQNPGY